MENLVARLKFLKLAEIKLRKRIEETENIICSLINCSSLNLIKNFSSKSGCHEIKCAMRSNQFKTDRSEYEMENDKNESCESVSQGYSDQRDSEEEGCQSSMGESVAAERTSLFDEGSMVLDDVTYDKLARRKYRQRNDSCDNEDPPESRCSQRRMESKKFSQERSNVQQPEHKRTTSVERTKRCNHRQRVSREQKTCCKESNNSDQWEKYVLKCLQTLMENMKVNPEMRKRQRPRREMPEELFNCPPPRNCIRKRLLDPSKDTTVGDLESVSLSSIEVSAPPKRRPSVTKRDRRNC